MGGAGGLRALVSWNLWLIPNSSPFPSVRPPEQGARLRKILQVRMPAL